MFCAWSHLNLAVDYKLYKIHDGVFTCCLSCKTLKLVPNWFSTGFPFKLPFSSLCSLILLLSQGIIKHGGEKPNIIPAYAELAFYLRTPLFRDLQVLKAKAEACFRAAALATGCQVSARLEK